MAVIASGQKRGGAAGASPSGHEGGVEGALGGGGGEERRLPFLFITSGFRGREGEPSSHRAGTARRRGPIVPGVAPVCSVMMQPILIQSTLETSKAMQTAPRIDANKYTLKNETIQRFV